MMTEELTDEELIAANPVKGIKATLLNPHINKESDRGAEAIVNAMPDDDSDELTTAQVAEMLATDPRTLRKFLRDEKSQIRPVGKGKIYTIDRGVVEGLRSRFDSWKAAQIREKKVSAPKK